MRQKMLEHRVRADCVQCHRLMDPIGFALENFDGIGAVAQPRRGHAGRSDGAAVRRHARSTARRQLRNWLVTSYSTQFVAVATEKLLTYALGRGVEYQDMPLVRAIARDAVKNDNRFSALVLGVVKSKPFQMNMKVRAGRPRPRRAPAPRTDTTRGVN